MRKTFQKWLLVFVTVAFVVTFLTSFGLMTLTAKNSSESLINMRLNDASLALDTNNANLLEIEEDSNSTAATKARASSAIISLLPGDPINSLIIDLDVSKDFNKLYYEVYDYPLAIRLDDNNEIVEDNREFLDDAERTASEKEATFNYYITLIKNVMINVNAVIDTADVDDMHIISGYREKEKVYDPETGEIIDDKSGYILGTNVAGYFGYDMFQRGISEDEKNQQSVDFMNSIYGSDNGEYVQKVQKDSSNQYMQYAGCMADPNLSGTIAMVEIGYQPTRLTQALSTASVMDLAKPFKIGETGGIFVLYSVVKEGQITFYILGLTTITEGEDDEIWYELPLDEFGINSMDVFEECLDKFDDIMVSGSRCTASLKAYDGTDYFSDKGPVYILAYQTQTEIFSSRNTSSVYLAIGNFILFAIVFILVSFMVDKVVIEGIHSVNGSLEKITEGDLNEMVNVNTNMEFVELSTGINAMVEHLKLLIEKEKNRLKKDLEMAKSIQASALPSIFPPYPERKEFDIYATMRPAKEVGGDFYDFFFIDGERLVFLVADVSGKGIPGALFMMRAKSTIKSLSERRTLSPSEIMTTANAQLCEENDAGMFVTCFFCMLNVNTGLLTYVNAGHNPPLMKHNGMFEYLKPIGGFVLAGLEGFKYKQADIQLEPGDLLYLYTDGVTEAENIKIELYGEDRLLEVLNSECRDLTVEQLLPAVTKDLDTFVGEAEQFDDITQITLEYHGSKK